MNKVLAKVILLTKNEVDLIEDFVTFYALLFGYENIVIVDNMSSDSKVLQYYEDILLKGVTVIKEPRQFALATCFMTEHMRTIKDTCEFMFPLETDEFLFLPRQNKITRESVHNFLKALPVNVSIIRYGHFWGSVVNPSDSTYENNYYSKPPRQMSHFYDQNWDKSIVRSSTFLKVQLWCHKMECTTGAQITCSDVGLLHFHNYGFRKKIERSIPVIQGYDYIDLKAPIIQQYEQAQLCCNGLCGHKVKYYMVYLQRKIIIDTFKKHIGRLPLHEEIKYYMNNSILDRDIPILRSKYIPDGGASEDNLLYEEDERDIPKFLCTQVIDFLNIF